MLTKRLLATDTSHFIARDFQSRNVMLVPADREPKAPFDPSAPIDIASSTPMFIDYQNGRRGSLAYDVASLLYDGKAALDPDTRASLMDVYLDALSARDADAARTLPSVFPSYALVRILQAMGAYGYLGFYLRKPHFLASVPHAVRNLTWLHEHEQVFDGLPEFERILDTIRADERFTQHVDSTRDDVLTVHITSFAYKHGYPADPGGHGGGFVFDCRAIPNPGREAEFAPLCGLDAPVREHLDTSADARAFFDSALALVRPQVARYRERQFNSLAVSFGCTGGQHRSVWCAERMATALRTAFGDVRVRIDHRERERWPATAGLKRADIDTESARA